MAKKGETLSAELKQKMSESAKKRVGEKNPFFGRKHTPETLQKMAAARSLRRGWKHTEETKAKIRESNRMTNVGSVRSEESRLKQGATMRRLYLTGALVPWDRSGASNPQSGKPMSEETKEKLRISHLGKVATVETREKMRSSHLGKKVHSEAFKEQVAERNRQRLGVFKHSEATKEKISASNVWNLRRGLFRYLGWVNTIKAGRVGYRSSWELRALELLESDPEVIAFQYERLAVPYLYNGKKRNTLPDYVVKLRSGQTQVIEVKPRGYMNHEKEIQKREAVKAYCITYHWEYVVWDEYLLWPKSCPRKTWVSSLPTT